MISNIGRRELLSFRLRTGWRFPMQVHFSQSLYKWCDSSAWERSRRRADATKKVTHWASFSLLLELFWRQLENKSITNRLVKHRVVVTEVTTTAQSVATVPMTNPPTTTTPPSTAKPGKNWGYIKSLKRYGGLTLNKNQIDHLLFM
jgi:hypothetical protein